MRTITLLLAAIALVAAACASDSDTATTTTAPADTEASTASAAGPAGLELAETAEGTVLVSSDGFSLYLFTNDSPNTTTCGEGCIDSWPAFAPGGLIGDGVDASLVGETQRPDGTMQATYNGWPLYYFAGDAAPGDTNGQGVGEVWYLVNAEGSAVTAAAGSSEGGGYGY